MKSVTVVSENCNTWNKKDFANITDYELECSSCSAYDNFSYVQKYFIWRWEINIPYEWKYGKWDDIRLYPTTEPIISPISVPITLRRRLVLRKRKIKPTYCCKVG